MGKPAITHKDIRAERARHKVTQAELAARLGWARPILSFVENGGVVVTDEEYTEILDAIREIGAGKAEEVGA